MQHSKLHWNICSSPLCCNIETVFLKDISKSDRIWKSSIKSHHPFTEWLHGINLAKLKLYFPGFISHRDWGLYQPPRELFWELEDRKKTRAIDYYLKFDRGPGEMAQWLRECILLLQKTWVWLPAPISGRSKLPLTSWNLSPFSGL